MNVVPDVHRVSPHAGRLDGVNGLFIVALPAEMLRTYGRNADLQELWDVVDQGEDGDGDNEGSARVFSPETGEN